MAHPEFFPQLQGFQSFALSSHMVILPVKLCTLMLLLKGNFKDDSIKVSNNTSSPSNFSYVHPIPISFTNNQ